MQQPAGAIVSVHSTKPLRRPLIALGLCLGLLGGACGGAPATQPPAVPTPAQPTPTLLTPAQPLPTAQPTATPTPPTGTPGGATQPPTGGQPPVNLDAVATGTTPPGWVEVITQDGACRIAVPDDWYTDVMPGAAQSPALEVQAMMGHDAFSQFGGDWPAYVELIRETFITDELVLLSTDDRFLMRSPEALNAVTFMAVVLRDASACTLLLNINGNQVETMGPVAVQVLESFAPVP